MIAALAATLCLTCWLAACSAAPTARVKVAPPAPTAVAAAPPRPDGLTANQAVTLASLRKVDDYPLYTMRYQVGRPRSLQPLQSRPAAAENSLRRQASQRLQRFQPPGEDTVHLTFACSLFAALGDPAPGWPVDGMNEAGVAVGMAVVPQADERRDPGKPAIDSLQVTRKILDRAGNVDEAVAILRQYNIAWEGGPPLHYLVADRSGRAALVEFYGGEIAVLPNAGSWHVATNFTCSAVTGDVAGQCLRYGTASPSAGTISVAKANRPEIVFPLVLAPLVPSSATYDAFHKPSSS